MTALRGMPNIGSAVAAELEAAGIANGESLMAAGSIGAAIRLRSAGFGVCHNKLCALEGAIRGVRWTLIPGEERQALWAELRGMTEGL